MALLKTVLFKGITINHAYIRVVSPTISLDKKSISYGVHYHANSTQELFDAKTIISDYDLSLASNPFQQAYGFLKTTAEFENSEDC